MNPAGNVIQWLELGQPRCAGKNHDQLIGNGFEDILERAREAGLSLSVLGNTRLPGHKFLRIC